MRTDVKTRFDFLGIARPHLNPLPRERTFGFPPPANPAPKPPLAGRFGQIIEKQRLNRLEPRFSGLGAGQFKFELSNFWDKKGHFKLKMKRFKLEMRHFKPEMKHFKFEMFHFKLEMRHFKLEMFHFKFEMRHFKLEMLRFKLEMNHFKPEMKLGRLFMKL